MDTKIRHRITNKDILLKKKIEAFKNSYYTKIRNNSGRVFKLSKETRNVWKQIVKAKQRPAFQRKAQQFIELIKKDSYNRVSEKDYRKHMNRDGEILCSTGGIVSTPKIILEKELPGMYGQYTVGWTVDHQVRILVRDLKGMKQTLRHEVLHYIDDMSQTPCDGHGYYWGIRLKILEDWLKI